MDTLPVDLMVNETEDVDCAINDHCTITLRCNDKRFIILLSRSPALGSSGPDSVEVSYLDKLDSALRSHNDEAVDRTIGEISGHLSILCQPFFRELAPNHQSEDLETCYNPKKYYFQMVTRNGKAKIITRDHYEPTHSTNAPIHLPSAPANCPIFHPKDIRVLEKYKGTRILKVLLGGQSMCCKITDKWTSQSIARELQCLLQISMVDPYPSIRVPKVCGLVGSREQILGFLISYISPHPEAARMDLFDMDTVSIERREKWANQIIQTVEQIHEIGVIWGDAKAANILIDVDDNAWLVDFGGSWTAGWVDSELAGTIPGDLQGLRKILEYLKMTDTLSS
jgi:Protein kinase domain